MKTTKLITPIAILAACVSLFPTLSRAQIKITEVEPAEAGGLHADWWELTNLGNSTVDLTGYRFNDDTGGFSTGAFVFPALSLGAGESGVFVENANAMTVQGFRDWWGPGLSLSTQVTVYSGSGLGLGSGGDQVNIWDSAGTLIDGVVFGAATAGTSFVFDTGASGRSPIGQSQSGVNGAFTAAQNGDLGSPGVSVVPEPSTLALAGLSVVGVLLFRRR